MKLCTGINCPDKHSKCCDKPFTTSFGEEGTNCWICDECKKPCDPQECTAGRKKELVDLVFTKEAMQDAARYSNFSQAFKMLMWERGFSGEEKFEEVAMELWKSYMRVEKELK